MEFEKATACPGLVLPEMQEGLEEPGCLVGH